MSKTEAATADPDTRSGLELVMARAAIDPAFRRRLLDDSRCAIADTFGIEVPASLRLKFVEKDSDVDLMFVLPDLVVTDGRLSDEDLRTVAGGATAWPWLFGDRSHDPALTQMFSLVDP